MSALGRLRLTLRRRSASSLVRLLRAADLCFVDVGARGSTPPELNRLAPYSRLVAFEPEPSEAERLGLTLRSTGNWRSVAVVPEALGAERGEALLHVTEHEGMSSLLPPDDAVVGRYWKSDAFRVVRTEPVSIITLDAAAARYGFADACYLKLDTQGTELDILRLGDDLVRRSVVGIYVETLFQPFYLGQPLFGDVDAHLRQRGFVLVEMRPWYMRSAGFREGSYSRRQPVWAHCLYLRDRGSLAAAGPNALARYVALALAYEHFDLAFAAVGDASSADALGDAFGETLATELEAEAKAATTRHATPMPSNELKALLRASGSS